MADTRLLVQGQDYFLQGSGVLAAATSVVLKTFKTPDGTKITMADFGTLGRMTFEPETSREENFSFTGVTQNADGTATITGLTRGLGFVSPYTAVAALDQTHAGSTNVRITNNVQLLSDFASKANDETITETWTFTNTDIPTQDSYLAPTLDAEFAPKKYVDDTAVAGAPDANETTKGIVELATNAEMGTGTSLGSTGARLVPPNDQLVKASSGAGDENKIAVLNSLGQFADGFIPQEVDVTYTAAEAIATNVPVCLTTTADNVENLKFIGVGTVVAADSSASTPSQMVNISANKVAALYSVGSVATLVIGDVANQTIVWGTPQAIGGASSTPSGIALIGTAKVAIAYTDSSTDGFVKIATISGTVASIGSAVGFNGTDNVSELGINKLDTDKFVISYYDATNTQGESIVATVSGTVPTFGTAVVFDTNALGAMTSCQLDTDKAFIAYGDTTATNGEGRVITVSGTVPTIAASVDFTTTATPAVCRVSQITTDKALLSWDDAGTLQAVVVSVSGTTPSFGTAIDPSDGATQSAVSGSFSNVVLSSSKGVIPFTNAGDGVQFAVVSISGTTLVKTSKNILTGNPNGVIGIAEASSTDTNAFVITATGASTLASYVAFSTDNSNQYVGVSAESIAAAATGAVRNAGPLTGFAGLTVGDLVYGANNSVSATATSLFVGVVKDTDEVVISNPNAASLETGETRFDRAQSTRAAATASGTETFTFAFSPSMIMFYTYGNPGTATNAKSIGTWTASSQGCVTTDGAGADTLSSTNVIISDKDGTDSQKAVASVSGTVLTLTWTLAASGEDAKVEIVAYK